METKEFEIRLNNWAEKIIDYCTPISQCQNLEYYPLQSPVNIKKTEVLIVGVNPRSNGNHYSQNQNEKWQFVKGKMTISRLLGGNPYFLNDNNWRFFNNLKQIDFLKNKIENAEYTYMNYFYFATKDANEMRKIDKFSDIIDFSKVSLNELIELLKPKLVVIMGVKDGLDLISDSPTKTILQKGNNRILTKGLLKNKVIYAIPHPSRNYGYDTRRALDICLNEIYTGKDELSVFEFENNNKPILSKEVININLLNDKLRNHKIEFSNYQNKLGIFEAAIQGVLGDVLDIRINTIGKEKYVSFRSKEKFQNSFYNHLKGKDIYRNSFSGKYETEHQSWLVYKNINTYLKSKSLEEHVSEDLIQLINKINKYSSEL
ncbi:MAG: hypothetical protein GX159_11415 [Flavobacteriaceae bacterium]|jgi:hypothetical protein|nr:hypothetical protein [Flavobacteriaceae bacterium]